MKLCSFFAIGVLASATCVWGVDEVVEPADIKTAPAVDREAFVARIAESKEAMKEQERVVSEVATDFFSLDKEREAKIQRVVTLLSGLRDSVDTRTQITDAKDKAIAALGKSFSEYDRDRRKVLSQLRMPSSYYSGETLHTVNAHVDDKLAQRVAQIMQLENSLHQKGDYKTYTTQRRVARRGRVYTGVSRDRRAVQRDRQQRKRGGQTREALLKAFEEERKVLAQRNTMLRAEMKTVTDPEILKRYREEIKRNEEARTALDRRSEQVLTPGGGNTKPVETKEAAAATEQLIRDRVQELEWDHHQMVRLESELKRELGKLSRLQIQVAQWEKQLAAMPAGK